MGTSDGVVRWLRTAVALLVLALGWLSPGRSSGDAGLTVDVALVLAIDCSDSVDDVEFRQQLDGLARAFRHPSVLDAIRDGPNQRIAVTVLQWSNPQSPVVVVEWSLIGDEAAADKLARRLERTKRLVIGGTSLSTAIDASTALLLSSPYRAIRSVIDISSDGINNTGGSPEQSRDRAVGLGIVINGLTILNEVPYLTVYFQNRVIGGPGKFVIEASDYLAYETAILKKLLREIVRPIS